MDAENDAAPLITAPRGSGVARRRKQSRFSRQIAPLEDAAAFEDDASRARRPDGAGDAENLASPLRPPASNVSVVEAEIHSENVTPTDDDGEKNENRRSDEKDDDDDDDRGDDDDDEDVVVELTRMKNRRSGRSRASRPPSQGTIDKLQGLRVDHADSEEERRPTALIAASKRDIDQVSVSSNDERKNSKKAPEERAPPAEQEKKQRRHPLGLRRFREQQQQRRRGEGDGDVPSSTEPEVEEASPHRQRHRRAPGGDGTAARRKARNGAARVGDGADEKILAGSDAARENKSGVNSTPLLTSSPLTKRDADNSDSALPADEEMTSLNSGAGSFDSSAEEGRGPSRRQHLSTAESRRRETKLPPGVVSYAVRATLGFDAEGKDGVGGAKELSDSMSSSTSRDRWSGSNGGPPGGESRLGGGGGISRLRAAHARNRNYLFGGIGAAGVSGAEELDRLFPNRKLSVFVATYNFNGSRKVPVSLDDILLPRPTELMGDVYIVGSQEHTFNQDEWDVKLQETLGPSFVLYYSSSHGVLHTAIFLRRELIWFVSTAEESTVTTRPVSQIKTKGALGTAFSVFGSSFLIVNSHMAANRSTQRDRLAVRLQDYAKIASQLSFKGSGGKSPRGGGGAGAKGGGGGGGGGGGDGMEDDVGGGGSAGDCRCDVTEQFDFCFWLGDLNFRLRRRRDSVVNMLNNYEFGAGTIATPSSSEGRAGFSTSDLEPSDDSRSVAESDCDYDRLCQWDELTKEMTEGTVFRGFQEGKIQFPPSYKYDVGEKFRFDTSSKKRVPAYTDRVLYRSRRKNQVACLDYGVCLDVLASDHKPVYGVYEATLKPGREHLGLAAGNFNREVYREGNRRRANHLSAQNANNANANANQGVDAVDANANRDADKSKVGGGNDNNNDESNATTVQNSKNSAVCNLM